ncbi:peptidoglycan-binding protein [Diplocloster agilis]|uniref:Peptidoglycan-binding protein n=1 Tax=Diplocloster agilis TaxID=2850323 RepID=A0A949NH01_9FIRM|nr:MULTISPECIES: peptidoglycan-binding protein [Lachnospiraceae]MBU9739669.1 peptidoglycan-binding protein [Diplocloster agilis]MBU9746678.1 peptidoglycan-binding protein [Diplocloster agilis]MCU6732301.1 peptidoglycan-binding protein [Suonthocola fibrivorans]SCI39795.1 N-acetylmuramoyl-L-alanine amidase CwlA precursor [uncultured Clostridium sp.]
MSNQTLKSMQTESPDRGRLQVQVTSTIGRIPISGATISISYTGDPESKVEQLTTNSSGQTETLDLPAPPLEYSLEPSDNQPYSEYTIQVNAPGYESATIAGSEVLPDTTSIQPVELRPMEGQEALDRIVIGPHTLFANYPPKIAEAEIKPVNESGEIVLSRVVVPEFVIVHDGSPRDTTATDYWVRYKDYIKNVASSEIYATWPDSTIRANVLAIMSFTLNRVYTEWYRNKGFDFTITSSTAFDHKWIFGRNIFDSISIIVDEIFNAYLSRPNVKQPILTQYCDGRQVTCPNWMTQWGSKYLGDQGYTPIEILRYYYGDSMYINIAEEISGVPSSWPGYNLDIGASGPKVTQLQEQLNTIAATYSAIPTVAVDGIYGESTANAVRTFQSIFGLPQTGITDYATWFKVQEIYVGVTRIAELS